VPGLAIKLREVRQEPARNTKTAQTKTNMPTEEWIKTIEDGRLVKFTNQTLPGFGAFVTAQIEKSEIVYSIVVDDAKNPLGRHEVENRFKAELSKR
jgi:hypothetical protein